MDSVDHVDDIGPRLTLNIDDQCGRRVHPAAELGVFGTGNQRGDILESNRRSVLVSDHDVAVILGVPDLVVGIDRIGAAGAVEGSLGAVLIGVVDGGAQVVDVQTVRRQRSRIHHDAYRGTLSAADADDAHAFELRDLLCDARVRKVFHFGERHHLGGDAQDQHRRIGGVDFGIDGRCRQILRQEILGAADRGLNLLFGDVDGERQIELQRDDRGAARTRRGHLVESRHLSELLLQGRRDGGCDDFGTCARIKRLHFDGRVRHLGQRRQGQLFVGDGAHDQDGNHQQCGCHRAQYEYARRIHCGALGLDR